MGSLESNLLAAEAWDFSENNLKNKSGFDLGPCDGGNGDMSTAYLTRWDAAGYQAGPVLETDDPYSPNPPYTSPTGLPEQKHVQEVLIIPPRANSLDNDNIKQALMDYGGVFTSYYSSGTYSNKSCPIGTCTTYYYSGGSRSDHAVTIVGWNDNFPASSFSPVPPGPGAFIIKNSWGTGWGVNGGYFYTSYYDSHLGYDGSYVFNGAEPVDNYSRVYQYDPLGVTSGIGYGSNTAWFANIFTAEASELVAAVSFYTASVGSSHEIYLYTDASSGPRSGSLAASTTASLAIPGYHTVMLPSSPSITTGQKFSVVVKLTTPGYNYPISVEYPYPGYSSAATAGAGQSYISSNGFGWTDVTALPYTGYSNANVCLKAFTAEDTMPPIDGTISATPGNGQVSLSWSGFSDSSSGLKSSDTYKIVRSTGGSPSAQCTSGTQVYLGNGTSTTDTGLTNGVTYYYRACAYDNAGNISSGAAASATLPVRITVTTSPAGRQFTVDGNGYAVPQTFTWTPGSSHTLGVSSPLQSGGAGTQYVFAAWSDGGTQNHIITPTFDLTYTASFTTQYHYLHQSNKRRDGRTGLPLWMLV
jgi:hypothetical protein